MDFQLPELGEGIYEAELVEWRVAPGDTVKRGQELAEVVTDKASMPLPSPFFGRVTDLRAQPGDMLKVGDVILSFEPTARGAAKEGDGEKSGKQAAAVEQELKPATKADARKNDVEKKVTSKREADKRDAKRSAERPSSDLRKQVASQQPRAEGASTITSTMPRPSVATRVSAAPVVRRMARQLGIDLAGVPGTGPSGRILIEDLTTLLRRDGLGSSAGPPEPAADYGQPGTRRKLIGVRRLIAEHMVQSKHTIPHYSYIDECDLTELVRLRASVKETFAKRGLKLTYLPFFVKAAVEALKEMPIVNSSLDESAGEIVLHDRYDIGIAVATAQGLLVPVIREADRKDITQLARDIDRLSRAARDGTAARDDLRGSTFTITSIGSIGGLISTPIINHPEAAILGIGRVIKRPVYDADGNLRPADLVYLSFSFDHRILDGAIGAAFGNAVIRRLQNPATLLVPHEGGSLFVEW